MNKDRIKIFHIIPTLDIGGAERLVVDITANIDQATYEVAVVCLKRYGHWGLELRKKGVKMYLLKQRTGYDLWSLFSLIRLLKKERPDIIHTHLFGGDFFGALASSALKFPKLILTEHNKNFFEGRLKRLIKRRVYRRADMIIAVSQSVKDYVLGEGADENKIRVVYNGVAADKFKMEREYYDQKTIVIGSAGRLSRQKGFEYLLEAIKDMDGVELEIAGEGPLRDKLNEYISKNNLSARAKLIGNVKDMPAFYREIDIFVLPSRWEGFGLVLAEAGLTGLPVIAARVDGIKEVISDGVDGLLFEPENSRDLKEKILKLKDDSALRAALGVKLRVKASDKFDIKKIVCEYSRIYSGLV